MKKADIPMILILLLVGFVCYFTLCSKTRPFQKSRYSCGVAPNRLSFGVIPPVQEAVFNPPYKWKETSLNVFFIDINDYQLMQKTLQVANTWGKSSKIRFQLVSNIFESHIRVSFREPNGYLSCIGNEAANPVYAGKATLWLQNLDMEDDAEFKRVVLHEFGHAIGLEHELQSMNATVDWDTGAVYKFYDTAYGWSRQKVDDNIFTKINTAEATRFDPESIMIYAVPEFLTRNHVAIPWPYDLSETDKKTIRKYYH